MVSVLYLWSQRSTNHLDLKVYVWLWGICMCLLDFFPCHFRESSCGRNLKLQEIWTDEWAVITLKKQVSFHFKYVAKDIDYQAMQQTSYNGKILRWYNPYEWSSEEAIAYMSIISLDWSTQLLSLLWCKIESGLVTVVIIIVLIAILIVVSMFLLWSLLLWLLSYWLFLLLVFLFCSHCWCSYYDTYSYS